MYGVAYYLLREVLPSAKLKENSPQYILHWKETFLEYYLT